ncbi:MAG: insulinase family protein [Bacteroidetes bacterium]|nr:insulinase family protein [Bacteroidota bacterium]
MKQAEVNFIAKGGSYNKDQQASVLMYSRYFGGGMSSPVFQVLRESKALAYAVSSRYSAPSRLDRSYYSTAYIGTQVDKLPEAMAGMFELLNEMPVSENNFATAKEGVLQSISTDRITRKGILNFYHAQKKLGNQVDLRKEIFEKVQGMQMQDIVAFQQQYLKGKKYRLAVIGNKEKIDFKMLEKYGPVTELELEQIFGY